MNRKIKKIIPIFISAVMFASAPLCTAADNEANMQINVTVNGAAVDFSQYDNAVPYLKDDITLFPIRAIAEALGAEVRWDADTQTVTVIGNTSVMLTIGSTEATVDGDPVTIDVPAEITNDRTFLPLRFVAEALKLDVSWDEKTYTVGIKAG